MNPELDHRLDESAPQFALSPDVEAAIAALVADTRATRRPRRLGRWGVPIAASTAGIVLAGSVAAAAALIIGGWTAPWADDPDGAIRFQLPSGTPCEFRIGNINGTDPELNDKLRTWLDDHTLGEIADVDSALRGLRGSGYVWTRKDGTEVEIGYGTKYYDVDAEYVQAVQQAIGIAIRDKTEEIGLPEGPVRLGHESEVRCVGKDDPSTPSWMR